MNKYYWLLIWLLIFSSCGTMRFNKTSDFVKLKSPKELDGTYLDRYQKNKSKYDNTGGLSFLFQINDSTDFFSIFVESPTKLSVSYINNKNQPKKAIFNGKMNKKFFEIYFKKKQSFIPLIYSSIDIRRIRIGKTKNGNLLIKDFQDQSGNILFLGAGYSIEESYKLKLKLKTEN